MEKLREMMINLAISKKNQPLSSYQIDLIHQRLHYEFPHGLRTPNHPPYANMINKAIKELNEEDGSTEAMISNYVKEQYKDLPWAHNSILNHHLNKLCGKGQLVFNASNHYSKPLFNEVQEFKPVNETSTGLLEENEPMEIDGVGDENLTGLREIALLEENPGQKEQDACEKRDLVITEISKPKMFGWNIEEALLDRSLLIPPSSLDCHGTEQAVVSKKRRSSDVEEKKKTATKLPDPIVTRRNNASKMKSGKSIELTSASLDSPSSNVLSSENDCLRIDRAVVCGLPAAIPESIKPKRSNTRKRRSNGKSIELTFAPLDSPSSNVLSSENDCLRIDGVVVCGLPAVMSDPIKPKGSNTRKRRSKGKSTELTTTSRDCHGTELAVVSKKRRTSDVKEKKEKATKLPDPIVTKSSNVLLLENECHGTELVVVPKKSESSDVMKKTKESSEPGELSDLTEPRRYNTRNSERKSTELIPAPLDSPSSNQQGALAICEEDSKITHSEQSKWPSWVDSLIQTHFFGKCEVHPNTNKSICTMYCLDCVNGAICASCVTDSHDDHRVIRIRPTYYEDAVNVSTMQTYLDISGIQIHTVNRTSSAVLSLKRMDRSRVRKANYFPCVCSTRNVPEQFRFCSLSCKYKHQLDVGAPSMIE